MLLKISTIVFVASITVILPIIVGSITVKKSKHNPLNTIFIYCVVYAVFEVIAWYYALNGLQNHFISNIFSYIDTAFWGIYFYQILQNTLSKRIVIVLSIATFIIIMYSHFGTHRDFNRIDSFAQSISNLSLIAMSLLFFYQLLNNLDTKDLLSYPHFWICVGVLVYFSGVFFIDIFAEYITFNKDKSVAQFWNFRNYLLFFQRIFLAIGLWFSKTPLQLSPSSK